MTFYWALISKIPSLIVVIILGYVFVLPIYLHYPSSSRPDFCVGWDAPLSKILLRSCPNHVIMRVWNHKRHASFAYYTLYTCNLFKCEINKSVILPTLKPPLACLWKDVLHNEGAACAHKSCYAITCYIYIYIYE